MNAELIKSITKPVILLFFCTLISCNTKIRRPNIILIVVDDLGWKDVGFMGSTFYETPNIDRIANEGLVFTQAYAAAAICSPTRASIQTGRYPARLGITDWIRGRYSGIEVPIDKVNPIGYELRSGTVPLATPINPYWMEHNELTIAELLQNNGYKTAHIGKWHLGPKEWSPESQGYDINIGGEDYGQPPTYFDPYERNGFKIESLPGRKQGEYLTDRESDEAVDFIRQHANKPFFLSLSHYAVHTPLMARSDYEAEFKDKLDNDPSIPPWSDEDPVSARFQSGKQLEVQKNYTYAAMIKSVDGGVGKITHILDSLGITQNTLIIFFSDNGGHIVSTSNAPLRAGKGFPYEGGLREPLVFSWPGTIEPGSREDMVISNDFFPTIANLTGTTIPDSITIDGEDISTLLYDPKVKIRRNTLFWHFPHYWWGTKVAPYSIIRDGNWKLIRWYENDSSELYNLENDLSETDNLVDKDPQKTMELNIKLDDWLSLIDAKLPILIDTVSD